MSDMMPSMIIRDSGVSAPTPSSVRPPTQIASTHPSAGAIRSVWPTREQPQALKTWSNSFSFSPTR